MMKWILAIVGYLVTHSFWGAVGGYLIGAALFPSSGGNGSSETTDGNTRSGRRTRDTYTYTYTYGTQDRQATARQAFLDSLLELSAHIIQADGRIMHSEMETTRRFFRANFGEATMQACNQRLLTIFEERRALSASLRWQRAYQSCRNIALAMNQEVCIQLMAYLVEIAKADGNVGQEEISALRSIAIALGLDESIVAQMLSLGSDTLDDAYKALGISPDATDDEVRKAYRKLALQYHPDRVATLGDDIREAATRKFQEINDAKERIFKARGM